MTGKQSRKDRIRNWLGSPWVTGLGLGLTIAFGFLSVHLSIAAEKRRDLVYYVGPIRAMIVKSGRASGLKIFHGDRAVKTDIAVVQVAVWNRGRESIRPENVLEQIAVETDSHTPILEATVLGNSRNATGFTLDTSQMGSGRLPVSWRILERNDGALLQLIYAGSFETPVIVAGTIEGQGSVRVARGEFNLEEWLGLRYLHLAATGGLVGFTLGIVMFVYPMRFERRRLTLVLCVLIALAVVASATFWLSQVPRLSPFGL